MILAAFAFFVIVFLVASILTAVAYLVFLKTRAEQSEAAASEHAIPRPSGTEAESPEEPAGEQGLPLSPSPLLHTDALSTITFLDSILERFDFTGILKARMEQADLNWSVGRITSMMLLIGVVALAVLARLAPLWGAVLGACGAMSLPYFYLLHRREKRFRKFRENFPDVLDSLARALRAGYPLSAAMDMIAVETAPPVSAEMRRTSAEANLGRGWPHALEGLGKRMPLLEVNLFIGAVQLHARTGGKLSEVMSGLAENMRESIALQGEVRALAAHGKLTGVILTILPIGIAIMMMVVSPGYMQVLFQHPLGKILIGAAIGCLVLAHFVIRKLVDIQV